MGVVTLSGTMFPILYCTFIGVGLVVCLFLAVRLHYDSVVRTHCHNWEFWPSVSSCTGDHMPERAVWRIAIALGGGPRFITSFLQRQQFARLLPGGASWDVGISFVFDIVRIVAAGMWTYVSSSEHLLVHEVAFVVYVVAGFLFQCLQTVVAFRLSRAHNKTIFRTAFRAKATLLALQVAFACGVGFFFVQHRSHCRPGGYSLATMCEWAFSICNVWYDYYGVLDLAGVQFTIGTRSSYAKDDEEESKPPKADDTFSLGDQLSRGSWPWWLRTLGFAADVWLGLLFWTFLSWLPLQVYFLPMVRMAFTAHPALLFLPAVVVTMLCSRQLPRAVLVTRKGGQLLAMGLALGGLLAYDVKRWPEMKLMFVAWGATWSQVAVFARLTEGRTSPPTGSAHRMAWALGIALVLHAVIRMLCFGQDPFVSDAAGNSLLMFTGAAGVVVLYLEEAVLGPEPAPPGDIAEHADSRLSTSDGVSLGLLLFAVHLLVSEHGIASRWVGLEPFPLGILPLTSFGLGVLASGTVTMAASHTLPKGRLVQGVCGIGGAVLAVYASGASVRMYETSPGVWPVDLPAGNTHGYYGVQSLSYLGAGVLFPFAIGSHWMGVLERALLLPAREGALQALQATFTASYVTQIVAVIMSVYVVAFTFVPGGALLRDRCWVVIIGTACGLWLTATRPRLQSAVPTRRPLFVKGCKAMVFVFLILAGVSTTRSFMKSETEEVLFKHQDTKLKAAIFTIHYGYDNFGNDNFEALVKLLRDAEANVIGLLETDISHISTANRDIMEYAAHHLGMHSDFGPTTLDDTFGCGLLSKYPIVSTKRYVMPSPQGELGCLIHAILEVTHTTRVNVYVAHFGNTEHALDRKLQSETLATLAKGNHGPSVFLGYLTTRPLSDNYKIILNNETGWRDTALDLGELDYERTAKGWLFKRANRISTVDPKHHSRTDSGGPMGRYCEYILYRGLPFTFWGKIDSGDISDTHIQVAHFDLEGM